MIESWNRDGSVVQDLILTDCSLNVIGSTSSLSRLVLKPLMQSWAFARFLDSSLSLVIWLTGGMYCPSSKGLLAILTKKSLTLSLYISVRSTRSSDLWDEYSSSSRGTCPVPALSSSTRSTRTRTSRMCVDQTCVLILFKLDIIMSPLTFQRQKIEQINQNYDFPMTINQIQVLSDNNQQKMLNDGLRDQFLQQNIMEDVVTVRITDKIFYQAYEYFKVCNIVLYIYALAKILATPYYVFTTELTHVTLFLVALFATSILQLLTCRFIVQVLKNRNIYYEIADITGHSQEIPRLQLSEAILSSDYRLSHIYDFTDPEAQEDERRMKVLSLDVKYYVHKSSERLNRMYEIQFGLYQVVHFWGVLLLIFYEFPEKTLQTYVIIIIVMGTYQYLEIYIIILFLIIVLPYLAIKQLYRYFLNKYKVYKMEKLLQSQPYNDAIKGDHQCKICLMPYQQNQDIIVLKCNDLHNFHSVCFREWAKTSSTCPLCRKDLTTF